eukprot:Phypoly_transcript_16384.p1 GENE.Phypoly_transcript_16384~~Phypoly_transcript_16384.p1  ORF type:complete len:263 (+),score=46.16 Phypoly_transcript_16384:30-818(+)
MSKQTIKKKKSSTGLPPPQKKYSEIKKENEQHRNTGKYLRDFVYGGLDGIITTFGCVSGVAGANLSCGVALVLGFANLLADGLSMAVGNYLGTKAEIEFERKERERATYEIQTFPKEEKEQIRDIFSKKGFKGAKLDMIVDTITENDQLWVDTVMVEECGILPEEQSPLQAAAVTFVSFNILGFIPLIAYVAALYIPSLVPVAYNMCVAVTLWTIFALGIAKAKISGSGQWFKSGIEMLCLGTLASFIAYYIGHVLHSFVPS